jgi:hypothetical protein
MRNNTLEIKFIRGELRLLIEWIINNKEWLFSGLGVVTVTFIISMFKKNNSCNKGYNHQDLVFVHDEHVNNVNNTKEKEEKMDEYNIYDTVDRFVEVYEAHNIKVNQIHSFVDKKFNLRISNFKSKDTILEILSDELLDYTASIFNINRSWLDGTSEYIYITSRYYKSIHSFIRMITELYRKYQYDLHVYMFKAGNLNSKERTGNKGNHVVLLIKVPIKKLNDTMIYSYIPIRDIWDWGYWRSRYQLKSIIWACVKISISLASGYDIDTKISYDLAEGTILPNKIRVFINSKYSWYPEDYSGNAGPHCNLEVDELPQIHKYIKDQKYDETFKESIAI